MCSFVSSSCTSFQRSNSENEDWNSGSLKMDTPLGWSFKGQTQKMRIEILIQVYSYHPSQGRFKGQTQKMRIEMCFVHPICELCSCFKGQTQKMRIEIFVMHRSKILSTLFQRSNSENEDWNWIMCLISWSRHPGFKGQTQKMRIEICLFQWFSCFSQGVSKVKLRKWGLK